MSTKPTDELLDHEYDGIREFDNPIPAWWTWLWVATIIFSAIYFLHYHVVGTGLSIVESYEAEMEASRAVEAERKLALLKNISEENLTEMMRDPKVVEAGAAKYAEICFACHGARGEGTVGPNLTDSYWLHADGTLMTIRKVIAEGVPEKGMPAWEKIVTPEELSQLVAFVGTIRGTQIDGKPPQGKKIELRAPAAIDH